MVATVRSSHDDDLVALVRGHRELTSTAEPDAPDRTPRSRYQHVARGARPGAVTNEVIQLAAFGVDDMSDGYRSAVTLRAAPERTRHQRERIGWQFVLPYADHLPPCGSQRARLPVVAGAVA